MDSVIKRIKQFDLKVTYQWNDHDYLAIREFFREMEFTPPVDYISFVKTVGCVYFNSPVKVECDSNVPGVSGEDNLVSIGRFLDWSEDGEFSISKIMRMYSEQLPDNFIPFAEGESGDYYGFSNTKDTVFISYWYHESMISQQIYKVSNDFESFLSIIKEYETDGVKISKSPDVKHTPSPKMIELLKKTGKWKGE